MIIYEGTNNFVSGAFLKCFSIGIADVPISRQSIYVNFLISDNKLSDKRNAI